MYTENKTILQFLVHRVFARDVSMETQKIAAAAFLLVAGCNQQCLRQRDIAKHYYYCYHLVAISSGKT